MGGDSPQASPEPRVLYFDHDAEAVADAWAAESRPFELIGARPADAIAAFEAAQVDCVVCRSDGTSHAEKFVKAVRASSDTVPIIVLSTGEGMGPETAMAIGATYVETGPEFDPIARLADVAPVVERHRETVRDRSMLESLLEQIPLSVYWKDRRSRHVKVSQAMLDMIGPDYIENPEGKRFHTPADVETLTDFDVYRDALAEAATADDREVMATEEPIVDVVEQTEGDVYEGTYVATSKAPWYDDQGRVIGMVGITRDISERMQYERQLERQNERLERFARVISHDLRNPLEVARGRLDLARESGDAEDHFGAMERALDRMDTLIDDVLTLAREGEVVADPEPVGLATAAENAWEVVDSRDLTLSIETEADVLADPGRLQQVFENCFRNSIEHATDPVRETPVTITVGSISHNGFFVEDDGQGVPADLRDEVFEPGFSADGTGTGLGLGIVRSIAEAHGWRVAVTESGSGGARFEFRDVRAAM